MPDFWQRSAMPELNGHEVELDPVLAAQQRLAKACMQQQLSPQGAGISAFVNGVVNAATVSALIEYIAEKDLFKFNELLLKHLEAKAELFENTAKNAPLIIANRTAALDS
jgi:hypothetical protein